MNLAAQLLNKDKILKNIIAVVGLPGTGKSEIVSLLNNVWGYAPVYFGGVVLEEVSSRGMDAGPLSERIVRESLREKHGMAAMAIMSFSKIEVLIHRGMGVVIDGLYSLAELDYLQNRLSGQIAVIAVSAHRSVRYKRMQMREIRPLGKSELDERDRSEVEKLDKARPIVFGDYQITNNGTREELAESLKEIIILMKKEK